MGKTARRQGDNSWLAKRNPLGYPHDGFDRRSGNITRAAPRNGAGRYNWGTDQDEIDARLEYDAGARGEPEQEGELEQEGEQEEAPRGEPAQLETSSEPEQRVDVVGTGESQSVSESQLRHSIA